MPVADGETGALGSPVASIRRPVRVVKKVGPCAVLLRPALGSELPQPPVESSHPEKQKAPGDGCQFPSMVWIMKRCRPMSTGEHVKILTMAADLPQGSWGPLPGRNTYKSSTFSVSYRQPNDPASQPLGLLWEPGL